MTFATAKVWSRAVPRGLLGRVRGRYRAILSRIIILNPATSKLLTFYSKTWSKTRPSLRKSTKRTKAAPGPTSTRTTITANWFPTVTPSPRTTSTCSTNWMSPSQLTALWASASWILVCTIRQIRISRRWLMIMRRMPHLTTSLRIILRIILAERHRWCTEVWGCNHWHHRNTRVLL